MPTVELSDADFKRLQAIAVPFVDTPSSVINRLIDLYEASGKITPEHVTIKDATSKGLYGIDVLPPPYSCKATFCNIWGIRAN